MGNKTKVGKNLMLLTHFVPRNSHAAKQYLNHPPCFPPCKVLDTRVYELHDMRETETKNSRLPETLM